MVESGQPAIIPVEFSSRRHADLPVEVLERHEIFSRVDQARLRQPERLAFHALILIHSGGGTHTVDFEDIPARSGRLLWVRPGQVQAWSRTADFEATLVLSRPAAPVVDPWFPGDGVFCDLDGDERALAEGLIGGIRREQSSFIGSAPQRRLMLALFVALTALFVRTGGDRNASLLPAPYVALRELMETDLAASHDVTWYVDRLGYSARTLSRACLRATGQTAKQVLVERLVLEAKRLLVHTELSAAAIATELGFSEATNFGKFFARHEGTSPARFRAAVR